MSALVDAAPGCRVQIEELGVVAEGDGWIETSHLEIAAEPRCPYVDLALPPEAALEALTGRIVLGDDTRRPLGPERISRQTRDRDGVGAVRVALPDLIQGDRVFLDLTRRWTGSWAWTAVGTYVSLETAVATPTGLTQDDGRWWASPAPSGAGARFGEPVSRTPLGAPAAPPTETAHLTLLIPTRDPRRALYPGGGSQARQSYTWTFAPDEADRGWVVPLPPGTTPEAVIRPDGAAEVVLRDDSALLRIAASEGPAQVTLAWTTPDAPTFGSTRGYAVDGWVETTVDGDGVDLRWEGDGPQRAWTLAGVHDAPVLPDRARLSRGLAWRFESVSNPAPGPGQTLRGRTPDPAYADEAWALLRAQWGVGPGDPLWPRRLLAARRSGYFTEIEAALTLVSWLRQGGLDADWLLTQDPTAGPAWRISPADHTHPLVQVRWADDIRWIDVGCRTCAPWELRPSVTGDAIGIASEPPPTPAGRTVVAATDQGWTWTFEDAAALVLREQLADVPADAHPAALAALLGGTVVAATGTDTPGTPVVVTVAGDASANPFQLENNVLIPIGSWEVRGGPPGVPWSRTSSCADFFAGLVDQTWVERVEIRSAQCPDRPDAMRAVRTPPGSPPADGLLAP